MTIDKDLLKVLRENGYHDVRELPDGRIIGTQQMMFTTGLFVELDEDSWGHRYCYARAGDAIVACATWDGVGHPPGPWIKRKGLGGDLLGPGAREV